MRCVDGKGRKCVNDAVGQLYAPGDMEPIPGPGMCNAHGQIVMAEYRKELNEVWTFKELS